VYSKHLPSRYQTTLNFSAKYLNYRKDNNIYHLLACSYFLFTWRTLRWTGKPR